MSLLENRKSIPIGRTVPTESQINAIPLAYPGIYELSEKEMRKTRAYIYGINKDAIRRFRTMREGALLFVWRIK